MSWQQGGTNTGNNVPGGNMNSGFRRGSYRQSTEDGEIGEEEGEIVGSSGTGVNIPSNVPAPPPPHASIGSSSSSSSPPGSMHRGGSGSSFSASAPPLHRSSFASGGSNETSQNRGVRGPISTSGFTANAASATSRTPLPLPQQTSSSLSSSLPSIPRSLPPQQPPRGSNSDFGPTTFGSRPPRGRGGTLPPRSQSLTFQRPSSSSGGASMSTANNSNNMTRPDGPIRSASFTPATAMSKRPTDPRLQSAASRAPNFVPSSDRSTQHAASQQQQPPQPSSFASLSRGSALPGGDRTVERTSSMTSAAILASDSTQPTIRGSSYPERSTTSQLPTIQQQQQPSGTNTFRSSSFSSALGGDNRPPPPPPLPASVDRRSSTGDRPSMLHHQQQHHHHNISSTEQSSGFTVRQSHHQPTPGGGFGDDAAHVVPPPQHSSYSSLADSSPFPIPKKRDNDERFSSTGSDSNRSVRRDGRGNFPPSGGSDYSSRRSSTDLSRDSNAPLSRNTSTNYDYYGSGASEPSSSSRQPHGRAPVLNESWGREGGFGPVTGSGAGRPSLGLSSAPSRPPFHRSDPRFPGKPDQQYLSESRGSSTGDARSGPPATSSQSEHSLTDDATTDRASRELPASDLNFSMSRGGYQGGDQQSNDEPPGDGASSGPPPLYRKKMFRSSPVPPPFSSSQVLTGGGNNPGESSLMTTRRPSNDLAESSFSRSRFCPPHSNTSSPAPRRPVFSYASLSPSSSPRKLAQVNRMPLPPSAPTLNLVVEDHSHQPSQVKKNSANASATSAGINDPAMQPSVGASNKTLTKATPVRKPPLLTSSLGQSKSRAEEAIVLLKELMPDAAKLKEGQDEVDYQLPAKDVIMTAMNQLNLKIDEVQSSVQNVESECEAAQILVNAQEAERIQKEEEERAALEASIKLQQEKAEIEKKKEQEEQVRRQEEFQQFMDGKRQLVQDELKKEEKEMDDRIAEIRENERVRKQQELDEQINLATTKFEKDIAKARRDLNRAEQLATKAEVKVATMEAEYRSKQKEQEETCPQINEGPQEPSTSDIVANILAENQRRAAEAHLSFPFNIGMDDMFSNLFNSSDNAKFRGLESATDPKYERTNLEWSIMARQVTGPGDALYTEPSEAPYFEHNEKLHEMIGPLVKEYVRDKQRKLDERWRDLAEEYYVRRQIYRKRSNRSNITKKTQRSMSISSRKSIFGDKVSAAGAASIVSGSRNSSNPYRRARRGNEVRSEYEQEQIIAELAAKEAMEKRIAHGVCYIPRQIVDLEKELTAAFIRDFTAQRIHAPLAAEDALSVTNVWSDIEKSIFLDRFLQYPKDFRKIATYLRNKTTKDCIAFYYNSKQTVPYKTALKEHIMRRKRRGDYPVWDATVQAALSVGATVSPGNSEDRPLAFALPEDESTYYTHGFHPMKLESFASMVVMPEDAANTEDDASEKRRSRKRGLDGLFVADPAVQKILRLNKDSGSDNVSESATEMQGAESVSGRITPIKRIPQKWTSAERKLFLEAVNKYGKDWQMLVAAVGTKSLPQIKNYYYDYKKQSGKRRNSIDNLQADEKRAKPSGTEKSTLDNAQIESSVPTFSDDAADIANEVKDDNPSRTQSLAVPQQEQLPVIPEEDALPTPSSSGAGLNQSDIWAQVQQQTMLQSQQQQQHNQLSMEETLRLLHHHNQTQQQQQQQQLLSWLNATQMAQAHAAALHQQQQQQQQRPQTHPADAAALAAALAGNNQGAGHTSQEWGDIATNMQSFLSLRQGGHHPFGLPSAATSSHLSSLALAGLGGLSHLRLDNTSQPTQQRGGIANEGLVSSNSGPTNALPHGYNMYPSIGNNESGHSMPGNVLDMLGLIAAAQARGEGSGVYHHHPYNLDGHLPDGSDRQDNY